MFFFFFNSKKKTDVSGPRCPSLALRKPLRTGGLPILLSFLFTLLKLTWHGYFSLTSNSAPLVYPVKMLFSPCFFCILIHHCPNVFLFFSFPSLHFLLFTFFLAIGEIGLCCDYPRSFFFYFFFSLLKRTEGVGVVVGWRCDILRWIGSREIFLLFPPLFFFPSFCLSRVCADRPLSNLSRRIFFFW